MGAGVVTFETHEEATRAITMFNETVFMDRSIRCREDREVAEDVPVSSISAAVPSTETSSAAAAVPGEETHGTIAKEEVPDPVKVVASNLGFGLDADAVSDFFCSAGEVKSAKKLSSAKNRPSPWVITFNSPSEAQQALDTLNGAEFNGKTVKLRQYYK